MKTKANLAYNSNRRMPKSVITADRNIKLPHQIAKNAVIGPEGDTLHSMSISTLPEIKNHNPNNKRGNSQLPHGMNSRHMEGK